MVMASLLFVKRMATIQQNNMLITQTLEQLQDLTPLKADRLAYAAGRITLFMSSARCALAQPGTLPGFCRAVATGISWSSIWPMSRSSTAVPPSC